MIKAVKKQSTNLLVTYEDGNSLIVPTDKNNRQYKEVLQWVEDGGVIQDEFTSDEILVNAKLEKTREINTACSNEIINGFVSDALGTEHSYKSGEIDQLNLVGIVTAGDDDYFKTGVDTDGVIDWNYEMHTIEQLTQVLKDGKAHKQTLLQKANGLKVQVVEATTVEEIEATVW